LAKESQSIQGHAEGVFWERNTLNAVNGRARQLISEEQNMLSL
jgi:hypothetical protein